MTNKLLLERYFKDIWNYNPPPFEIIHKSGTAGPPGKAPYYGREQFGRSYFMPVSLGATPGARDLELRNPVVKITCRKTIVETAMVNRPGTIKELINTEDYKINIKGIIIREDNKFPLDEIAQLNDYFTMNMVLYIRSKLTDVFLKDGAPVVFTDIAWPETVGVENVKAYEINLISDSSFKLVKE